MINIYVPVVIFALWMTLTIYLFINNYKNRYFAIKSTQELIDAEEIMDFLMNKEEIRNFLESKEIITLTHESDNTIVVSWNLK